MEMQYLYCKKKIKIFKAQKYAKLVKKADVLQLQCTPTFYCSRPDNDHG